MWDSMAMPMTWFVILAAAGASGSACAIAPRTNKSTGEGKLTSDLDRLVDVLDRRIANAVHQHVASARVLERGALAGIEARKGATVGGHIGCVACRVDPCVGRPGIQDQGELLCGGPDLDVDGISGAGFLVGYVDLVLARPQLRDGPAGDRIDGGADNAIAPWDDGLWLRRCGDGGR